MRRLAVAGFSVLFLTFFGCGSSSISPNDGTGFPKPGLLNPISLAPSTAVAGSADLQLTIMGSNFQGARHVFSQAVWSVNGSQTLLTTSFVSSSQLTALVPANLLTSPVSAQVFVQTGDPMSDGPLQKSDSANFSVTALGGGSAAITEILPASAAAGSSDVTITLRGSNFNNERLNKSIVGWSTNSNDAHCCNSWLQTTFINTTELKAVIPADLLRAPISATVFVETGDPQGIGDGVSYPRSNFVVFTVGP